MEKLYFALTGIVGSAGLLVHRTRVQVLVLCWTAVRALVRYPACLRGMGVSCRLKRRGDFMRNLGRMVRGAIVAILVAGAAHAQTPANAPSNASPDCADLPSLAAKLDRTDRNLHDCPDLALIPVTNTAMPAPTNFDLRT